MTNNQAPLGFISGKRYQRDTVIVPEDGIDFGNINKLPKYGVIKTIRATRRVTNILDDGEQLFSLSKINPNTNLGGNPLWVYSKSGILYQPYQLPDELIESLIREKDPVNRQFLFKQYTNSLELLYLKRNLTLQETITSKPISVKSPKRGLVMEYLPNSQKTIPSLRLWNEVTGYYEKVTPLTSKEEARRAIPIYRILQLAQGVKVFQNSIDDVTDEINIVKSKYYNDLTNIIAPSAPQDITLDNDTQLDLSHVKPASNTE